ncbi:MAG: XdhC family protein [Actinomycetales bacterium]
MFDIALSAAACVRAGTRFDVAWICEPAGSDEAVAFTPGGGRFGGLANGVFDGLLSDVAARQLSCGRHLVHQVSDLEAVGSGLTAGSRVEFLVVPGSAIPGQVWGLVQNREPIRLLIELDHEQVTGVRLLAEQDTAPEGALVTEFSPVPRLIVAGGGPMADAMAAQGRLLGWKVAVSARPEAVAGLTAPLTSMDSVVVLGHDVEASSRCLMAALASDAGYIGSVGSQSMQRSRADWLAYQEVIDLSRVHGPAGLALGAQSPPEVAVAIAAEILATRAETHSARGAR